MDKKTLSQFISEQDSGLKKPIVQSDGILGLLEQSLNKILEDFTKQMAEKADAMIQDAVDMLNKHISDSSSIVKSIQPVKGDKGEKGDVGESVTGPMGPMGMRGMPGPQGPMGPMGPAGMSGMDTKHDHSEMMAKMESLEKLVSELSKKESKTTIIKRSSAPIAMLKSRSKPYMKFITATGAINGSNTEFYLSEAPRKGSQFIWMLDNTPQEPTQNYTIQGVTLNYNFAPQTGQRHWGIVFKP